MTWTRFCSPAAFPIPAGILAPSKSDPKPTPSSPTCLRNVSFDDARSRESGNLWINRTEHRELRGRMPVIVERFNVAEQRKSPDQAAQHDRAVAKRVAESP